jgi:putative sensor histidine protein kinase uhpB
VVKMTNREKKELIEAEETILQLFFDAYERAMK